MFTEQIAVTSADDWKLVVSGPDIRRPEGFRSPRHRVELFQLSEDPGEKKDLSASRPELVAELGRKLIAFRGSEPSTAMAPQNEAPRDFKPPRHWLNAPTSRPSRP